MTLPIPANAVTACQKCGECCKRYAISVLPNEVERQAKFFKLPVSQFMGIYTRLLVQIVPFSSGQHPLALHTSMIPKALWKKLQDAGFDAEYAMILPMIGFRKQEYCVFFDPKSFGCTMHPVKPLQCSLFPFTSLKQNEDYAKAYDFCELSTITSPTKYTQAFIQVQRQNMHNYFDAVAQHGLAKVWPALPAQGEVVYNGKALEEISLETLNEWLELAGQKNTTAAPKKAAKKSSPKKKST